MILGIFTDKMSAENAINDLKDANFEAKDISIVMKNREDAEEVSDNTGANVMSDAVSGATTGGVIGGLAGLLIGVGAITIPGIGALLIGGPLAASLGLTGAAATTLTGAATGALAGGLVGALVSLGVSEEDAALYEDRINEGGILVAVAADHDEAGARDVLEDNGADQIRTIGSTNSKIHEEKAGYAPAYFSDVPKKHRK